MCVCRYTLKALLYSSSTCSPQAKEKQEELAMDMKILEKLLDDTRNEVKEETQRKVCSCFIISFFSLTISIYTESSRFTGQILSAMLPCGRLQVNYPSKNKLRKESGHGSDIYLGDQTPA